VILRPLLEVGGGGVAVGFGVGGLGAAEEAGQESGEAHLLQYAPRRVGRPLGVCVFVRLF
jgi:hypothetical protein